MFSFERLNLNWQFQQMFFLLHSNPLCWLSSKFNRGAVKSLRGELIMKTFSELIKLTFQGSTKLHNSKISQCVWRNSKFNLHCSMHEGYQYWAQTLLYVHHSSFRIMDKYTSAESPINMSKFIRKIMKQKSMKNLNHRKDSRW